MANSNGKVRITEDELEAPSEIKITLSMIGNPDKEFDLYFGSLDPKNDFRGRKLRQKDVAKAQEFLFNVKFLRSSIDWNDYDKDDNVIGNFLIKKGYASGPEGKEEPDEKRYFLKDEKAGQVYMRTAIEQYWREVTPDVNDTKG